MRIIKNDAYICSMKARLNLTIDEQVLASVKNYADSKNVSISELVENFFKDVVRPTRKKSIIDIVEKLDKPAISDNADLKDLFYKEQSKKYGF